MKKYLALAFASGALLLSGCSTTSHVTKWEYKQLHSSPVTDETLNKLGDEGWEAIGVSEYDEDFTVLLKRQKVERLRVEAESESAVPKIHIGVPLSGIPAPGDQPN